MLGLLCAGGFAEESETKLFNGKDFTGWKFEMEGEGNDPANTWSVVEGVIVCKGSPAGVIRTEKDYENYELSVEWRWPEGKEAGNSGLLVHCSSSREMGIWPKSLEVQLQANHAGDFWMIGESVKVADREPEGRRFVRLVGDEPVEKPVGEWNTMTVVCEADQIEVRVNGILVNQGSEISARSGAISLQSEGSEVHFRGIVLKPLVKK